MTSDEAWAALVSADQEKDLDDFKVFFLEYVRNNKSLTFVDLEKKFREEGLGVYLIAMVSSPFPPSNIRKKRSRSRRQFEISKATPEKNTLYPSNPELKIVELGIADLRYTHNSATKGQVASTPEENLERLADAGFLVEDLIPVCFNCNAKGHGRNECPEPMEGSQAILGSDRRTSTNGSDCRLYQL